MIAPAGASRKFVWHPFLFAILPALILYSRNAGQVVPSELILPLIYLLSATLIALPVLAVATRDWHKGGLIASSAWILFFSYSAIAAVARSIIHFDRSFTTSEKLLLFAAASAILVAFIVVLRRTARSWAGITAFLNVASTIVLAITLTQISVASIRSARHVTPPSAVSGPDIRINPRDDSPDIYYIILDGYGGAGYLKDVLGVDVSPFQTQLKSRGFYIASNSHSNYCHTRLSLPSSLNMDYLHNLVPHIGENDEPQGEILARLISENAIARILRKGGYEFIAFSTGYTMTQITTADRYLEGARYMTEFQATLYGMSPLRSLIPGASGLRDKDRWDPVFKEKGVPFILENLPKLERRGRPMFVFAHIISPHSPHVFDADGRILHAQTTYREGYINELQFINRRITEVMDEIVKRSPSSVIVLQGDHGPWLDYGERKPKWEGTQQDLVRDRTEILNAYRIPDERTASQLYDTISPVNTFRVILNGYFGQSLSLLADKSQIIDRDSLPKFWIETPRATNTP
jgi:hypothetical protein